MLTTSVPVSVSGGENDKCISLRQIVDGCFMEYWQKKSEYLTVDYVNLCFPRCSGVPLAPKWTKKPTAALKYGLSVNKTHCVTSTSTTSIPHNFPAVLDFFSSFFILSFYSDLQGFFTEHNSELRRASITSRQLDTKHKSGADQRLRAGGLPQRRLFSSYHQREQVSFRRRRRDVMKESMDSAKIFCCIRGILLFYWLLWKGCSLSSRGDKDEYRSVAPAYMYTIHHGHNARCLQQKDVTLPYLEVTCISL